MFAKALKIDIELLLDEYTRFTAPGFGAKIKAYRNSLGVSQTEFAKRLGVNRGTVAIWEIEYHRPSRAICEQLIPQMERINTQ